MPNKNKIRIGYYSFEKTCKRNQTKLIFSPRPYSLRLILKHLVILSKYEWNATTLSSIPSIPTRKSIPTRNNTRNRNSTWIGAIELFTTGLFFLFCLFISH